MESTPVHDPQFENALMDAQLVVDYTARAGLLKEGSSLVSELEKSKKIYTDNDPKVQPEVGKLLEALSEAVNDISDYASLIDLRSGYSPFSWCYKLIRPDATLTIIASNFLCFKGKISKPLPILFLIISITATFILMDRYRNNLIMLKSISQLESVDLNSIIDVIVQGAKDDIINSGNKNPTSFLLYINNTKLLIQTQDKANTLLTTINKVNTENKKSWFSLFYPIIPSYEVNPLLYASSNKEGGGSKLKTQSELQAFYASKLKDQETNKAPNEAEIVIERMRDCDIYKNETEKLSGFIKVALNKNYTTCIEEVMNLKSAKVQMSTVKEAGYFLSNDTYRLTAWLLPLAVGLVGASVFLIYTIDHRRPYLSLHRTTLRYILGGVSGVIIAWFYAPAYVSINDLTIFDTRQFPFMFAFLAGFSTDTLLTILSRKVQSFGKDSYSQDAAEPKA